MNRNDLAHLKKWFADYVAGFYTDHPADNSTISLKEKHTEHVCENMILLGKASGLSDEEMVLTETMALFHDVGRFKQYAVYGTFKDADSENHALLGIRELAAHNVLDVCTKEEKNGLQKPLPIIMQSQFLKKRMENPFFSFVFCGMPTNLTSGGFSSIITIRVTNSRIRW
jgi:hypothetical protein